MSNKPELDSAPELRSLGQEGGGEWADKWVDGSAARVRGPKPASSSALMR